MKSKLTKFIIFMIAGAVAGGLTGYARSCVEGG